jgi:hypothetical protein
MNKVMSGVNSMAYPSRLPKVLGHGSGAAARRPSTNQMCYAVSSLAWLVFSDQIRNWLPSTNNDFSIFLSSTILYTIRAVKSRTPNKQLAMRSKSTTEDVADKVVGALDDHLNEWQP